MRSLPFALLIVVVLAASRPAGATSNFPPAIQTDLAVKSAPACGLCHTTGSAGGRGTVNTPFGANARAYGLVAYDAASLKVALDTMAADGTDSDGDCIPDIKELENGTDPNVPDNGGKTCASTSAQGDMPRYGCGARVAAAPGPARAWPGLSLLVALLAVASRRRRRRDRRG